MSIKQWKRDLTEPDRVLQNNTNEKEIKEAKVKELNGWKQNDVLKSQNIEIRN